jgi:hypothetical protein
MSDTSKSSVRPVFYQSKCYLIIKSDVGHSFEREPSKEYLGQILFHFTQWWIFQSFQPIRRHGSHLGYSARSSDTILGEDHPRIMASQGFSEDQNVKS